MDLVSSVSASLAARRRVYFAVLGLLLLTPLVVAARLQPSPTGMGTHQQLGLPPCSLVTWFGVRCPACGMTTSWAYAVRGRLFESVTANAGGMLLAIVALTLALWLLGSAALGRFVAPVPSDNVLAMGVAVITVVTLGQWIYRLAVG